MKRATEMTPPEYAQARRNLPLPPPQRMTAAEREDLAQLRGEPPEKTVAKMTVAEYEAAKYAAIRGR